MKIALLGAESTGKSHLARALSTHFSALGFPVHRIDEYLREWCDAHQRTPEPHEQLHIAETQIARVLSCPPHELVIADTTALMTAVYSQLLFNDHSLDSMALTHQTMYDLTLLTGLDVPWVSDGIQRTGPEVREPVDQRIRHMLGLAACPYQVVYGLGQQRLENALYGLARHAPHGAHHLQRSEPRTRWTAPCDHCSNGVCERHLFMALNEKKALTRLSGVIAATKA